MKTLARWIREHPVVAFFVLTYALSWGLWTPWMLTCIEVLELLGAVGLFAPAPACIAIARVVEPGRTGGYRGARRMAFLTAWILATAIFILNTGSSSGSRSPAAFVVFAMLGLLPAFLVASGLSANRGVRARLASLVRPRGHLLWTLLALLLVPALRLASVPVNRLLGWETISDPLLVGDLARVTGTIAISFLYTVIAAGGHLWHESPDACFRHVREFLD